MDLTITHNGITFVDAQAMRIEHTTSFNAPAKEDLEAIKAGDWVKVSVNGERFWVIVKSIKNNIIKGTVVNNLLQTGIKYNDEIEFPNNCILQFIINTIK